MEIKLTQTELTKLFNYLNQQPYQFSAPIIKLLYEIINSQKEEEQIPENTKAVKAKK